MPETCDEPQLAWISNETFASVLTDVAIDKFYENVCLRQSSPFSEQDFEFFLKNPATILTWTEDAFENLVTPPSGMTRNFLEYDASALVMLLQRFSDTNE